MARRFGRNQKRKLREQAKNALTTAEVAKTQAKMWERQAASDKSAQWDLVENVERLLGSNSAVLPPKDIRARYEAWDNEPRMEMSIRDWSLTAMSGPPVPRERVYAIMNRLHAEVRSRPELHQARHFYAEVQVGPHRWVREYHVSLEGMRVVSVDRISEELTKTFVEGIRAHFNKLDREEFARKTGR
jgi:hypothetical protein